MVTLHAIPPGWMIFLSLNRGNARDEIFVNAVGDEAFEEDPLEAQ